MKTRRTWIILDGYEVTLYKKQYIVRTPQGRYITNRHNRPKRFVLLRHVTQACEQHAAHTEINTSKPCPLCHTPSSQTKLERIESGRFAAIYIHYTCPKCGSWCERPPLMKREGGAA